MKNFIKYLPITIVLCVLVGLIIFNANSSKVDLGDNQIYFFTKKHCPYCEVATEYIKIAYPRLEIRYLDIHEKKNYNLLVSAAEKYNLDTGRVGTPFICMGNNYLLGWSIEQQGKFDNYVRPFLKQQKVR